MGIFVVHIFSFQIIRGKSIHMAKLLLQMKTKKDDDSIYTLEKISLYSVLYSFRHSGWCQ